MNTTRRSHKLLALAASSALVFAACGSDDADDAVDDVEEAADDAGDEAEEAVDDADEAMEDDETSDTAMDETTDTAMDETTDTAMDETTDTAMDGGEGSGEALAYGNAQEFSNYNNGLAAANSVKNTIVLTQVRPAPFNFAGPTGELELDEELMDSVEVLTEDPLVTEYVVNADAVWSDGEPIDCDDFYFEANAFNGQIFELDDSGEPVIDEETEAEVPLFPVASSSGYQDIDTVECSEDGKTITVTYATPFSDWRGLFLGMLPAHVIEREAGVEDVVAAFDSDDREAIEAMADFFVNGYTVSAGEILPDIMLSGGKMAFDSWEAGSSLTLVPNSEYWGTPANGPITYRYIAEEAQAQALANGEINAMDPQPTVDLLGQLEGLDGVTVETGNQYTWEHFDMNLNTEAFSNRQVREAFALCLPREQMVQNLIQPLVPEAEVLNNRLLQEFESAYVDNSGGNYPTDLERAQQLLDESGVEQPVELRLGWFDNGGNQRRTDQVALTIESCNQIGFNIVDNGSETFFDNELSASDYDIAMFAWAGSPLKAGVGQLYACDGGANYNGYCNEEVDELISQIDAAATIEEQLELSNQVDALLWEDLVTIPVFSFPGVAAWTSNVENVVYNPSNNGLPFNAATWQAT